MPPPSGPATPIRAGKGKRPPATPLLFSTEQTGNLSPERAEEALNGPLRLLLERATMNWTQSRRLGIAIFEVLVVDGTALDGLQVRHAAEFHAVHAVRNRKLRGRELTGRPLHEVSPDRQGDAGPAPTLPA